MRRPPGRPGSLSRNSPVPSPGSPASSLTDDSRASEGASSSGMRSMSPAMILRFSRLDSSRDRTRQKAYFAEELVSRSRGR